MRVYITAGEASGDKLGAALMEGLRAAQPEVTFQGIGGQGMMANGLRSLFPMEELSVMGIVEILKRYRHLKARIAQTAEDVIAANPDVLVTIDAPEFSLRLAKLVKAHSDIRIVHYVAPTVWAWRPKRAAKMAPLVDQVLALLPFEPPYMQAAGIECDFVGHPVVTDPIASDAQALKFRDSLKGQGPVALLLPGSRGSELKRLLPVFHKVAQGLLLQKPDMQLVMPAAPGKAEFLRQELAQWSVPVHLIDPSQDSEGAQKRAAFRAADVAIAASGTVSLELAANSTPMVIAYDMGLLSRQIIGRMLLVDTVTLVNLVTNSKVIPEFIGAACQPKDIVAAAVDVLSAPEGQIEALRAAMVQLGKGGEHPGHRAAQAILQKMPRI